MKFGQNYLHEQIPYWAHLYSNYNSQKRLVKTALQRCSPAERDSQCKDVLNALNYEIDEAKVFCSKEYEKISHRESLLSLENAVLSSRPDTIQLDQVDKRELVDWLAALAELHSVGATSHRVVNRYILRGILEV
ncbi:MAG: hypothetical protein M1820_008043 [Bogoriella megaspora]|nr:MAG: hypothetical protein M1820_008043 [Bogoriella megaspora]